MTFFLTFVRFLIKPQKIMTTVWNNYRAIIQKDGKWFRSGLFLEPNVPVMLGFIRPISEEEAKLYLSDENTEGKISKAEAEARNAWIKRFFADGYILEKRGSQVECILDGDKYPTLASYKHSILGRNPRNLKEHLLFA